MKKTLSLILAVMMLLGCMSITAFAETPNNAAEITAEITAADFGYEMVIPTATTLTEANHENVLLGTDGKVSITNIKHPNDKVNVVYTVDLSNGNLTDGTTTINATYKYKQGDADFAAIDGTTKVTVYANATVNDSLVNVTANKDQWNAAAAGTYTATVTFNFTAEELLATGQQGVLALDAVGILQTLAGLHLVNLVHQEVHRVAHHGVAEQAVGAVFAHLHVGHDVAYEHDAVVALIHVVQGVTQIRYQLLHHLFPYLALGHSAQLLLDQVELLLQYK